MKRTEQIQRDLDRKELHAFGYAQQLFRDMGGFSNFAISFSIISILTGAVSLYGYGFGYAGPAANGLGWPLVTFFTLFVAASMAELASAIPTSGALYHWAFVLGGRGWGWITAWLNLIGQFTITAGIDFAVAQFIQPLLGLPATWTTWLWLYALVLLSHGLLNHFGIRIVAGLNNVSAWYHMVGVGLIVGAVLFFAKLQPVHNLFTVSTGHTEFPIWMVFLVAMLQAQWTYTGYDASAHVTEETINPRVRAAWGVYLSVALSAFFGFVMLAVVTLGIHDPSKIADGGFIEAITQAIGETGGKLINLLVIGGMWFAGLSSVTSNSRMLFAFARDKGLPGWRWLGTVSPKWRIPVTAVWVSVVVAFLAAVYSGAYPVLTSISTIGLYVPYVIPVALRLVARAKGRWTPAHDGPWNLGRFSTAVNVLAVAWVAFITVLFVVPPNLITGYTFAGALVLLGGYWLFWERKRFVGPQRLGADAELERIEHELEQQSVWASSD